MKKRYIISSIVFIVMLFSLSVMAILKPADESSLSERRPLAQFPELSIDTILSGDFTSKFEDYATDQFPARDSWRTLKAIAKFYIFNQKDNNDIYIHDGYASKLDSEIKVESVENAVKKIKYLYDTYVKEKSDKVYFSVIPDKSYTLAPLGNYPYLDAKAIVEKLKEDLDFAKYIDILPLLDYTDYYKTDTHWSQEKVKDVADKILDEMGAEKIKNYKEVTLDKDFYGVYYGQSSLPLPPDKITYITSDSIENSVVYNYEGTNGVLETIIPEKVYNEEKLNSKDPYEMFLSGASYLIRIVNPENTSGKRLIVFRDSFSSSLAPLMTEGYSEIILVDIRYVYSHVIGALISEEEFKDADVLFLYSAMILNDSYSFK
ncbi:MAG: hypothetical protein E7582_01450 [Ruminococcaceae bacterium]|nr:hypothetical protein [Oscillospiraceae bacterium]